MMMAVVMMCQLKIAIFYFFIFGCSFSIVVVYFLLVRAMLLLLFSVGSVCLVFFSQKFAFASSHA
jgi:hypothetical protein